MFDKWREARKRKREQQEAEQRERLQAIKARLLNGQPPQTLEEVAIAHLFKQLVSPTILTCPQGIITYTKDPTTLNAFADFLEVDQAQKEKDDREIQDKLMSILALNPKTDLKKYEFILGIKILDFQPSDPSTDASPGVVIGE